MINLFSGCNTLKMYRSYFVIYRLIKFSKHMNLSDKPYLYQFHFSVTDMLQYNILYLFHIVYFPFKIQTKLDNSLIINFSFIPLYQDVKRK